MNLKRAFLILIVAMLLPGLAMAQVTLRFGVSKNFTDENPNSIEVTISCNTGLPLTQSANITELDGVAFVVEEVAIVDGVECVITEDGEAGYDAIYSANDAEPGVGGFDGCYYDAGGAVDNLTDLNSCEIVNDPAPVPVIVTKKWVIAGAEGDSVDTSATVLVRSESFIEGGELCGEFEGNLGGIDGYCRLLSFEGDGSQTVMVKPDWDGSDVYISEILLDSSVESENGCGGMVTVFPTDGSSCMITNSVFFEGIPTLNQYGLAILAVLMLGVGFVGFRRFV